MIIFIVIMIIIFLLIIAAVVHSHYAGKENRNPVLKKEAMADHQRMIQFNELQGKKPLQQFLNEYPQYQKDTLESEFASISQNLISLTEDQRISPAMLHLMKQHTKRRVLLNMKCQRTNLLSYKDQFIYAIAVYADHKQEYVVSMRFRMEENHLYLFAFDITLGSKTNLLTK